MDRDNSDCDNQDTSYVKDAEENKSFVGKVRSRVSGLLNTSLSKWFGSTEPTRPVTRRRDEEEDDDDDDEESYCIQPPPKRSRPSNIEVKHNNFNINNLNETRHYESTPISNNNYKAASSYKHFPEPVAGPSGLKSRKTLTSVTIQNHYSSNQDTIPEEKDSDSGESTSGYSSMARLGSKEHVSSESAETTKNTSVLNSSSYVGRSLFNTTPGVQRSLFTERSLSPQVNSSLSSRRPSFNASTFGSPNFVDRTISTRKIVDSPFYKGNTIYGGASAYGRRLAKNPADMRNNLKESIRIKPVNEKRTDSNSLSKTAQRILNTLEQYSTPIRDAKKMPVPSKKLRIEGSLSKYIGAKPYTIRENKPAAVTRELQVPTVPDLLRMKERLQESTESVRQIATSSKSILNQPEYEIITVEDDKNKHTNKMKTKMSTVRHKPIVNESAKEVKLIPVALPITTLPKFDLTIPPPSSSKPASTDKPLQKTPNPKINIISNTPVPKLLHTLPSHETQETEQKSVQNKPNDSISSVEYKFSKPLVIAENIKTIIAMNNFRFSEPVTKKPNNNNKITNFNMPENKGFNLNNFKTKRNGATNIKSTSQLCASGSVMDILRKKDDSWITKFKPAEGTWECSTCLIRNQPDKSKCEACETPKVTNQQKSTLKTFGDSFKMSTDKWECEVCMVRNNNTDQTCVACSTPKPQSGRNNSSSPCTFGFSDKFKAPPTSWECGTCFVRNVDADTKCVACETQREKIENLDFPKSSGKWDYTCMIKTPENILKCSPCETLKPGSDISNNSLLDGFKKKSDEWECSACMVKNKSDILKCVCCETSKPGLVSLPKEVNKIQSSFNFGIDKAGPTNFKFGIPADKMESPKSSAYADVFGDKAKSSSTVTSTFTFGIKTSQPETVKQENTTTSKINSESVTTKSMERTPDKTSETKPGIVFGTSLSQTKISTVSTNGPIDSPAKFEFKPPAANGDIAKPVVFGTASTTSKQNDGKLFGATAGTEIKTSSFGVASSSEAKPTNNLFNTSGNSEAKYLFGSNTGESKSSPSKFNISTDKNTPTSNIFGANEKKSGTFGSGSSNDSKTTLNMFGPQPIDPNKQSNPNTIGVSDHSNKPTSNLFGTDNKPTSSLFGSSNASKQSSGIFAFGASTAESKPVINAFGVSATESKPTNSLFGSKDNMFSGTTSNVPNVGFSFATKEETKPSQLESSNAMFKFGTPSHFQPSSVVPQFEASKSTFKPPEQILEPTKPIFESPKPSNNHCFGMNSPSNPPTFGTPSSVSLFGSPAADKPIENKPFKFGGDEPPAKAPMFGFGQTPKTASTSQTPTFNFGSSTPTVPQNTFGTPTAGGFGMSQDKPTFGSAPSNNLFSAPAPTVAKNGGFNFGMASNNNNNQKAGFSFGAVPSQPAAPQMNASFNFGAQAPNAPSAGGFNFAADPNMKPSFNFTGGTEVTTFTAQPNADSAAAAAPQRKIRRAIRRTPR